MIEDAIDVVVENERHSLRFGGMDESVFTEWVATQKKVNRRDRSPALQALLENEDDVRSELFVDGKEASASTVLKVFTARRCRRRAPRGSSGPEWQRGRGGWRVLCHKSDPRGLPLRRWKGASTQMLL